MTIQAGDTIERIRRGHYRLSFFTHGEKQEHREVQLWDTVEKQMVKGTTESAIIAMLLLDPRTAAKHFGDPRAKRELEEVGVDRPEGLQRVLAHNPHLHHPPEKQGLGFTLREVVPVAERVAEAARIDSEEQPGDEDKGDQQTAAQQDISPQVLTDRFEFESLDAKGLFTSLCVAFGTDRVGKFLAENHPGGALDLEWVAAMSEELSGPHRFQVIEEQAQEPAQASRKRRGTRSRSGGSKAKREKQGEQEKAPEVFDPTEK